MGDADGFLHDLLHRPRCCPERKGTPLHSQDVDILWVIAFRLTRLGH